MNNVQHCTRVYKQQPMQINQFPNVTHNQVAYIENSKNRQHFHGRKETHPPTVYDKYSSI